jgi:DEAD/DEAH box helicase domain-containing protein
VREPLPDAAAMVERLRRMRQQRERRDGPPAPQRPGRAHKDDPATSRFAPGDTVFCMPWGNGQVRSSRVEDSRELLVVHFADHGELTIDTAVSAVRLVKASTSEADDF